MQLFAYFVTKVINLGYDFKSCRHQYLTENSHENYIQRNLVILWIKIKLIYSEIKLFNRLICNTYNPNQKKKNQSSHSQRCNVDNVDDF